MDVIAYALYYRDVVFTQKTIDDTTKAYKIWQLTSLSGFRWLFDDICVFSLNGNWFFSPKRYYHDSTLYDPIVNDGKMKHDNKAIHELSYLRSLQN